jgi:N-carbamoyl-L-amino-acid hydrolase
MSEPANIAVNADRLWDSIMQTAKIGATPKGGVRRLTLTDLDRQVRDWFRAACEAAGCTVSVDEMGNMFARRPGRDNSLPPIAMGSHLDTQPTGGKFDGILGVLSGLEVVRTLNDLHIETNAPLEVVNWTNEEGSRFAPAMLCSGVFAGVYTRAFADSRKDREGKKFGEELERIGYRGTEKCGDRKFGAHFELHIEQGPILEAEGKAIGIVTGVQGMRWFDVTVIGNEGHSGSTPMNLRRDAMLAAARVIEAVNEIAIRRQGVGTVGLVECRPNSRNVIPGHVFFSIDFRHPEDAVVEQMEQDVRERIAAIAEASRVEMTIERVFDSPAVRFHPDCIEAVRRAAEAFGYPAREIVSGPGHDSCHVARVAPTSMIFVPCEGGLSHNELEKIEQNQAAAGANVLLRAVLSTDQLLAERARAG